MEQSLTLKQAQQMTMTPELQQAIQILQLSAQELKDVIEKEYLENPVLEAEENRTEETQSGDESVFALSDYLSGGGEPMAAPQQTDDEPPYRREPVSPVRRTLEEVLLEQAEFAFPADREKAAAVLLIGCIDDRGCLVADFAALTRAAGMTEAELLAVLRTLQGFEPAGVGARSLSECLALQAERQGIYGGLTKAIIERHLDALAGHDYNAIAKAERASLEEVQAAADVVRSLNPKPGSAYGGGDTSYVIPDVFVRKQNGSYVVSLNERETPHLCISPIYRETEQYDPATKRYISGRLRAALWLMKCIEQRKTTIRHVMEEIVRRQVDFIEKGPAFLHPMTMQQIADAIGVHESTVSRAVAKKYVQIPRAILPMRAFFSESLGGSGGEGFAAVQAKSAIRALIEAEDKKKPLSDQKICDALKAQGMALSRRTVMKYREQLGYVSSSKRKRF